jgi:hypothetical protein
MQTHLLLLGDSETELALRRAWRVRALSITNHDQCSSTSRAFRRAFVYILSEQCAKSALLS